jgi:outer membrane receptor protein involved in Fe transport
MSFKKLPLLNAIALICAAQANLAQAVDKKPAVQPEVDEVVITSRRESDYSVITEQAQKILDVPGALGDPLMAVFSLPGVLGSSGDGGVPAVRGSSPSDNRYMVDGAPAGYVFHSFSTSVFNENIIQDFELYSAGFGPNYSNAIGGVFDITLRDPKHKPFTTKVDLSMLRSGLFFEGEVTEDSAFYLSARQSMLQYFIRDKDKEEVEKEDGLRVQSAPQDSDYQFKYVYDINSDNKITLSANGATDLAEAEFLDSSVDVMESPDMAGDAKIENKYQNASLRWQFSGDKGAAFDFQVGQFTNHNDTKWGGQYFFNFKTVDSYLTTRYDFTLAQDHNISLGGEVHSYKYSYDGRFINYICTETDPDCLFRRGELTTADDTLKTTEQMLYLNDHWNLTDKLAIDLGVQGDKNDFTNETFYNPRAALNWKFAEAWTLTSSLGAYNRFPELGAIFPELGNPQLKSPTSNHLTLGLKQSLGDGWSWSATAYYKTMDDLPLAMAVGQTPKYTNNVEGKAYGLDIFINKEMTDRWYGWLALSTSKSLRTNKLTQKETNYYLDTPVVLNLVANYKFSDKWTFGGRFTTQTGHAYTPIIGAQKNPYFDNHILPVYGDAFSDNLPTYMRLDLRVKQDITLFGYQGAWTLDVLNALNTRNVTDRHLDYKRTTSPQNYKLEDEVGLGIVPAAGISITF